MSDQHRQGTVYVVMGVPGAGVKLVATMLAAMTGLDATREPAAAAEFGALSKRMLSSLGLSALDPRLPFIRGSGTKASQAAIQRKLESGFMDEAVALLRRSPGSSGTDSVLADPSCGLLLPFLHAAFHRAGISCKYVLAVRNPVDLASTLRTRERLPAFRVTQVCMRYNLAVLQGHTQQHPVTVTNLESLTDDIDTAIASLAAQLRIDPLPETRRLAATSCMDRSRRTNVVRTQSMAASPLIAEHVKSLYRLLDDWNALAEEERQKQLIPLSAGFDEISLFAGNFIPIQAEPDVPLTILPITAHQAPVSRSSKTDRHVLLHYHLFKNAGTSVDAVLEQSFKEGWTAREFPPASQCYQQAAVAELVAGNPAIVALSSHTLNLPLPSLDGVSFFPIIFVREPLARLRSAYEFERHQDGGTMGAALAKKMDFRDYLRARLENPYDRSCRDFQTFRFSMVLPRTAGSERDRAMAALEILPFVGLVEEFAKSMQNLERLLADHFPSFKALDVRKNVTARHDNRKNAAQTIHSELGDAVYQQVIEANQGDLALYEAVRQRYAA